MAPCGCSKDSTRTNSATGQQIGAGNAGAALQRALRSKVTCAANGRSSVGKPAPRKRPARLATKASKTSGTVVAPAQTM